MSALKYDPVEQTEAFKAIEPELRAKLEILFKDVRRSHGFCLRYWQAQQEILMRDYGIEWKSPSQLNPRVRFD